LAATSTAAPASAAPVARAAIRSTPRAGRTIGDPLVGCPALDGGVAVSDTVATLVERLRDRAVARVVSPRIR
jgi:hypothetical protein